MFDALVGSAQWTARSAAPREHKEGGWMAKGSLLVDSQAPLRTVQPVGLCGALMTVQGHFQLVGTFL